jgi:hypothetical protein
VFFQKIPGQMPGEEPSPQMPGPKTMNPQNLPTYA